MNEWKKLISLNLALAMLLGLFQPMAVFAAEGDTTLPEVEIVAPAETETEPATEPATEEVTEPVTLPAEAKTEPVTEPATEEVTEPATLPEAVESQPLAEEAATDPTDESTATTVASGLCGTNLSWELDSEGVLTVTGLGKMYDYESGNQPWYQYRSSIKKVVLEEGVTSVGDYAFCQYFDAITEVSLPSTLTAIGDMAFYDCDGLLSASIPGTVTEWGDDYSRGIFEDCSKLTTVTLGSGLESIPDYMFRYCDALTSIVIPEGVTFVGTEAFYDCDSLLSASIPGTVINWGGSSYDDGVFQGCSKLTTVTLGSGLEYISYYMFNNCSALTSIAIPDSVTSIAAYAFNGCTSLADVRFGSGVEAIGSSAFYGCAMETLDLPDSLTSIGSQAFRNITELTEVNIGSGIQTVSSMAFAECASLATVNIDAFEAQVSVAEDAIPGIAQINWREATADAVMQTWRVNDTVTATLYGDGTLKITGTGAMNNYSGSSQVPWYSLRSNIKAVVVAEGITNVANYAFYNHTALADLSLPATLTRIGSRAFYNTALSGALELPEGIVTIGSEAFRNVAGITSVDIGNAITSIEAMTFTQCTALTEVTVDAYEITVSVGESAFPATAVINWKAVTGDSLLRTWQVTDTITASLYGDGLLRLTGTGAMPNYSSSTDMPWYGSRDSVVKAELNAGITTVGSRAFYEHSALREVVLPQGITSIGYAAFAHCDKLDGVTLPTTLKSLGDDAFYDCDGLTAIVLPEGLTTAGSDAFYGCGALLSATIPGTITDWTESWYGSGFSIYNYNGMFSNCEALTTVTIGEGLTEIPAYTFAKCTGLTSVTLPDSVKYIRSYAFTACRNLAQVNIGSGITSVEANAFNDCPSNMTVNINAFKMFVTVQSSSFPSGATVNWRTPTDADAVKVWEVGDYDETDAIATLYASGKLVISGTGAVGTSPWRNDYTDFITSVVVEDGITGLPYAAFSDCDELVSADLGALRTLPGDLFEYCYALTTVTGMEQVTTIGSYAFDGCTSLTEVQGLGNVTSVGSYAFQNCTALKYVSPLNSVQTINSSAFSHCTALEEITIGRNLTSIGSSAFYNCTALKTLNWNAVNCYNLYEDTRPFRNAGCAEGFTLNIGPGVKSIPAYLFYTGSAYAGQEPRLKTVHVPANGALTSIGNFAFFRCVYLTDLNLGNTLQTVGDGAFNTCSALTAVTLPDSLTTLGAKAFYRTGLKTVNSASGQKTIGNSAFGECPASLVVYGFSGSAMEAYCSENGITFFTYPTAGKVGNVTWSLSVYTGKLTLSGSGVLEVSPAPWAGYSSTITSVTVAKGITGLRNDLFKDCVNLESVTFQGDQPTLTDSSGTVTTVPFAGHGHMNVYRPQDASWPVAWNNCTVYAVGDTKVAISIQENFEGGYSRSLSDYIGMPLSLTKYSVEAQARYREVDDSALLIAWNTKADGSGTSYGPNATITLSADLTLYAQWSVATYASLTLNCPEAGLQYAWTELTGTQIWLEDYSWEVQEIYQDIVEGATLTGWNTAEDGTGTAYAFDAVVALDADLTLYAQWKMPEVTVTASGTYGQLSWELNSAGVLTVTGTGEMAEADSNSDYPWWRYQSRVRSIVIGEGITSVSWYAFGDFYNAVSLSLPESLTYIGPEAFVWADSLTSVRIPDSVTTIEDSAFWDCNALQTVTIGKSVRYIGNSAFRSCSELRTITVGAPEVLVEYASNWTDDYVTVTWAQGDDSTVANRWFVGDYEETDATATLYTSGKLVIEGSGGFKKGPWTKVSSVVIGPGITSVPSNAFQSCETLTSVTLDPDVEEINSYAFRYCYALTSVNGLENVTWINNRAFYECTGLTSVTLSEDLEYLGSYAFYNSGLTSVTIPADVEISTYAFSNCANLTSVTVMGDLSYLSDQIFANCPELTWVYWNDSARYYSLHDESNLFLNSGKSGEGITLTLGPNADRIPAYLFYTSSHFTGQEPKLTAVKLAEGAAPRQVEGFAFYRCIYLTSVELGGSLQDIGDGAFNTCKALTQLAVPSTLRSIGAKAFYNVPLSKLELGYDVDEIGANAFAGCAEGFTLYGYSNTYPETYAADNGIPFVSLGALCFTIDGQSYPIGTEAQGEGWYYNGDGWLDLNGYNGGSILLPTGMDVYFYGAPSTVNGVIDAGSNPLWLYINTDVTVTSDGVAIGAGDLYIGASAPLTVTTAGQTAIKATDLEISAYDTVSITAAEQAVDAANTTFYDCTAEYSEDGSSLRLEPDMWQIRLNANGGTWNDQEGPEKIVETTTNQIVYLGDYTDQLSNPGYVLEKWINEDDTMSFLPHQYTSQGNLTLYAIWTEEMLEVGGERHSPKEACSGTGWSFTPATDDAIATLFITEGYNGGHIYCSESLLIVIEALTSITGAAAQPAIKVLGILSLTVASGTEVTLQGGSGTAGVSAQSDVILYNHGSTTIRGGEGGFGIDHWAEIHNTGNLSVVGGLRARALNGFYLLECSGSIIFIAGAETSYAVGGGYSYSDELALKFYTGDNEQYAVRTHYRNCPYIRIQPKTILLTLNANGGTIDGAALATEEVAQNAENAFVMAVESQPMMSGYTFTGWNTAADGSGTDYVPGETYAAGALVDSIVLYAQWQKAEISASYNADGTQVLVTLDHVPEQGVTPLLAAYAQSGQMLCCAEGSLVDGTWQFDMAQDERMDKWLLFFLDTNGNPAQDALPLQLNK